MIYLSTNMLTKIMVVALLIIDINHSILTQAHRLLGNVVYMCLPPSHLLKLAFLSGCQRLTHIHGAHSLVFISPRHIFHIEANQCVEEAS